MRKVLFFIIVGLFISLEALAAPKKSVDQFNAAPLSLELKKYIQQNYKVAKGKKLVLYEPSFLSVNCPYIQVFVQAFKKQRQRNDLTNYSFQQQILETKAFDTPEAADLAGKQMMNFVNGCGAICIVNLKNNWIYSIKYPGVEEAKTLSKVFTFFKNK